MKAFKIYSVGNQEVIVTLSADALYPSFLYSGFNSEEEAKQAVINAYINDNSSSNDVEAYIVRCEAELYVDNGTWIEILSRRV